MVDYTNIRNLVKNNKITRNDVKHIVDNLYAPYNADMHDPCLFKYLATVRPDWILSSDSIKKDTVYNMAMAGEAKPTKHSRNRAIAHLGRKLAGWTNPNSNLFDGVFTRYIQKVRPEWFN